MGALLHILGEQAVKLLLTGGQQQLGQGLPPEPLGPPVDELGLAARRKRHHIRGIVHGIYQSPGADLHQRRVAGGLPLALKGVIQQHPVGIVGPNGGDVGGVVLPQKVLCLLRGDGDAVLPGIVHSLYPQRGQLLSLLAHKEGHELDRLLRIPAVTGDKRHRPSVHAHTGQGVVVSRAVFRAVNGHVGPLGNLIIELPLLRLHVRPLINQAKYCPRSSFSDTCCRLSKKILESMVPSAISCRKVFSQVMYSACVCQSTACPSRS